MVVSPSGEDVAQNLGAVDVLPGSGRIRLASRLPYSLPQPLLPMNCSWSSSRVAAGSSGGRTELSMRLAATTCRAQPCSGKDADSTAHRATVRACRWASAMTRSSGTYATTGLPTGPITLPRSG